MGLRVKLTYPQELIQQPILFKAAMKFKVVPNIRRARVTEDIGELVLELEGKDADVDKMVKSLKKSGVTVEMIEGDIIE